MPAYVSSDADTRPGCDENQKSDVTVPPSDEGGGTRAARDGGRDRTEARAVGRGLAPAGKRRLVCQAVSGGADIENQNRRGVCPYRTAHGRARRPAPTSGYFYFHRSRGLVFNGLCTGGRGSPPLRVQPSSFIFRLISTHSLLQFRPVLYRMKKNKRGGEPVCAWYF